MEERELTARLKEVARAVGFDDSGVCEARPWPEMLHLDEWLKRGYDAGMWYMKQRRALRVDPTAFFPLASRAFMVVKAYDPPSQQSAVDEGSVVISRHAAGEDYHVSMRRMLQPLKRVLEEAGFRYRAFTDVAPVMEKVLAARAGLGVLGRNTLLTHPRFGSWVYLGGIVTNAPLHCDSPAVRADGCEECRRCLDACPGGALGEDGGLDSRRCLSYWTTEATDEELPSAVASVLGQRVFGCDRCQEVCPMNAGLGEDRAVSSPRTVFPLEQLKSMDEAGFLECFGQSTIRRLGWARFARNIRAIASPSEIPEKSS